MSFIGFVGVMEHLQCRFSASERETWSFSGISGGALFAACCAVGVGNSMIRDLYQLLASHVSERGVLHSRASEILDLVLDTVYGQFPDAHTRASGRLGIYFVEFPCRLRCVTEFKNATDLRNALHAAICIPCLTGAARVLPSPSESPPRSRCNYFSEHWRLDAGFLYGLGAPHRALRKHPNLYVVTLWGPADAQLGRFTRALSLGHPTNREESERLISAIREGLTHEFIQNEKLQSTFPDALPVVGAEPPLLRTLLLRRVWERTLRLIRMLPLSAIRSIISAGMYLRWVLVRPAALTFGWVTLAAARIWILVRYIFGSISKLVLREIMHLRLSHLEGRSHDETFISVEASTPPTCQRVSVERVLQKCRTEKTNSEIKEAESEAINLDDIRNKLPSMSSDEL